MNKIEILAPAGSLETFYTAIHAGADAVYLGGTKFGARAYADNFTEEKLIQAIQYAHLHNRKLYLTVNTLFKNEEIDALYDYLLPLYVHGLDAVIVQDLGVLSYIRRQFPDLPVHASTQMTIANANGVHELEQLGVTRVVPARELSLEELAYMKANSNIEFEVFVHGALCYCYSGQCLLSSMIGGRSGNRGRCAQPCRLPYQSGKTKYYLSPKDLCGLQHVPDLIQAGMNSLKIEGRMKNENYVGATVSAYREAVDAYYAGAFNEKLVSRLTERMAETYNRGGFTEGYYNKHNGPEMMSMKRPNHQGVPVGTIQRLQNGTFSFVPEKDILKGDVFEVCLKNGEVMELTGGTSGKNGETVTLKAPRTKDLMIGSVVHRMKSAKLVNEIQKNIIDKTLKEKVKMKITIQKDMCATMTLSHDDAVVVVSGDVVMPADKKPLQKDVVMEKMLKFGNTPFEVEACELIMDDNVFLPISALNQLRRDAVEKLQRALENTQCRNVVEKVSAKYMDGDDNKELLPSIAVYPMRMDLLECALSYSEIQEIYMDPAFFSDAMFLDACGKVKQAGKHLVICMPHIFRKKAEKSFSKLLNQIECFDGLLVRTLDELAFVKKYYGHVKWIGDYSLYAYNSEAVCYYQGMQEQMQFVMPRELSKEQLKTLGNSNMICDIYGNHPVMVSAQCMQKNTKHCNSNDACIFMTDRKQVGYDIQCVCRYCYNLMFNKVLYHLSGLSKEVRELNPVALRVILRDESKEQACAILEQFMIEYGISEDDHISTNIHHISDVKDFTRGHFKRGIE